MHFKHITILMKKSSEIENILGILYVFKNYFHLYIYIFPFGKLVFTFVVLNQILKTGVPSYDVCFSCFLLLRPTLLVSRDG